MSRIHHSAFDSGLIAVYPDYRIHIDGSLLAQHNGPLLEGMKLLRGSLIRTPANARFRLDRDASR